MTKQQFQNQLLRHLRKQFGLRSFTVSDVRHLNPKKANYCYRQWIQPVHEKYTNAHSDYRPRCSWDFTDFHDRVQRSLDALVRQKKLVVAKKFLHLRNNGRKRFISCFSRSYRVCTTSDIFREARKK